MAAGGEETVRKYYRTIDAGDYDQLSELLDPSFVQYRPDRTIDGRDAFVRFMREERPRTDTVHELDAVFVYTDGDGPATIAAEGSLLAHGEILFSFVDVHRLAATGQITSLRTYTR